MGDANTKRSCPNRRSRNHIEICHAVTLSWIPRRATGKAQPSHSSWIMHGSTPSRITLCCVFLKRLECLVHQMCLFDDVKCTRFHLKLTRSQSATIGRVAAEPRGRLPAEIAGGTFLPTGPFPGSEKGGGRGPAWDLQSKDPQPRTCWRARTAEGKDRAGGGWRQRLDQSEN